MKKVYLTEQIDHRAVSFLEAHAQVVQGTDITQIARQAQGCAAVLLRSAHMDAATMDALPGLQVIAKHGIGVDNIDVEAATARGILVVNAPFANINAVAEHAVTLLLAAAKNLVLLDAVTRKGGFTRRTAYTNTELMGKTVGLVGLGRIARLVIERLRPFGVQLVGYDPYVAPDQMRGEQVAVLPLEEVLARADFVSLHTPLAESTYHLISDLQLQAMKPTAWLINSSRGPVVDEKALIKALRKGEIAGAALDVFEAEPPESDNPLFEMDNVIISPHNAALTDNALLSMAMDSAKGVVDVLEGKRPEFPVNPAVLGE